MRASPNVELISVYRTRSAEFLYRLLADRPKAERISHGDMPSLEQHRRFMAKRPYMAWYLARVSSVPVGAVYLTKGKEVGISMLRKYRDLGYEASAIRALMRRHKSTLGICLDGRRHRVFVFNLSPRDRYLRRIIAGLGVIEMQRTFEIASMKRNGKYVDKLKF